MFIGLLTDYKKNPPYKLDKPLPDKLLKYKVLAQLAATSVSIVRNINMTQ